MPVDLYESQARAPQPQGFELGTMPQVVTSDGSAVGGAVSKLGEVIGHIGAQMKVAREQTEVATATSEYLVGLHEAELAGTQSTDFRNAPGTFKDEAQKLLTAATEKISDPVRRAQLNARLVSHGLSASSRVQAHARGLERDTNIAALDQQERTAEQEVVGAQTAIEREAAVRRYNAGVAGAVASGWISAQDAVVRNQRLAVSVDRTEVMRDVRADPVATREALNDPARYPNLPPVLRETYKDHAANLRDQQIIDQITVQAATDPETAREKIDTIEQPHNRFRAQHAIDQVVHQQAAEEDRRIKAQATVAHTTDPVAELIRSGRDVGDDRIEQARAIQQRAAMRGDLEAAKRVQEIDFAVGIAPHVLAAKQMPIGELDSQVRQLDERLSSPGANATKQDETILKVFKAVRDERLGKRDTDPLSLIGANGSRDYIASPIDPRADAADPGLVAELQRRGVATNLAQVRNLGKATALTAEDQHAFKQRWTDADASERTKLLQTFGATLTGNAYRDTVRAVAGDNPAVTLVGRLAQTRPELAREVLQGMALNDAEGVQKESKQIISDALSSKLAGEIYPSVKEQNAAVDAAMALYRTRSNKKGLLYDKTDEAVLTQALEDITGKITKYNGVRTPIPPGMTYAQFDRAFGQIDDKTLDMLGGARDASGNPVSAYTLTRNMVLKPFNVGGSVYAVGVKNEKEADGFSPYQTKDFEPLVIDLPTLLRLQTEQATEKARAREPRKSLSRGERLQGGTVPNTGGE